MIAQSRQKARKNYNCEGREQIEASGGRCEEEAEKQFQSCKGIKKGDEYEKQFNKDGDVYVWKSCLKCLEQISKYKLHDF